MDFSVLNNEYHSHLPPSRACKRRRREKTEGETKVSLPRLHPDLETKKFTPIFERAVLSTSPRLPSLPSVSLHKIVIVEQGMHLGQVRSWLASSVSVRGSVLVV